MLMTRRAAIAALAAGAPAAWITAGGIEASGEGPGAPAPAGAPPAAGRRTLTPLPFDPKKLRGLSERLIVSHHENNYGGALRNLGKVEEELARLTGDTPAFVVAGLKERELTFTNSVVLHELYFGNLGGDGKPGGAVEKAIGDAFGGVARWEEGFRATGMSLAGGSGWVNLCSDFQTGALRTCWAGNHTQSLAFGAPLLVMDMYEHAYHIDYGAAAARYIDAFFSNIRWEEVSRRFERAQRAAAALGG